MKNITTTEEALEYLGRYCSSTSPSYGGFSGTIVAWNDNIGTFLVFSEELALCVRGHDGHTIEITIGEPNKNHQFGHWWCSPSVLTLADKITIRGNEIYLETK